MEDTRKGFLTPAQEQQLDDVITGSKLVEALDGPAIKIADNQGLERLKPAMVEKFGPEVLEMVYEVVDTIFEALPNKKEE
jgi:hypothetical protein